MKVGTEMFLLIALEKQPLGINVKTDPEWSVEIRDNILKLLDHFT